MLVAHDLVEELLDAVSGYPLLAQQVEHVLAGQVPLRRVAMAVEEPLSTLARFLAGTSRTRYWDATPRRVVGGNVWANTGITDVVAFAAS